MKILQILIAVMGLLSLSATLTAEEKKDKKVETVEVGKEQVLRVGGNYKVEQIIKNQNGTFKIIFISTQQTGRFDRLVLESDHVNVAVAEGSQVRLSAEILDDQGASAEVAQLVLFLPSSFGQTPVWLLSNKASNRELRATKYIDMHMPLNDYFVL